MQKVLILIVFLLLVGLGYVALNQAKSTPSSTTTEITENRNPPENSVEVKTDIKASFAIFTNGTFRIFTDKRYHNLSPEVYIESQNPNVIKAQGSGVTWADFFETLPMELTSECLITGTGQKFCDGESGDLEFYINGENDPQALNKVINQKDRLLVTFGNPTEKEIQEQLSKIPVIK